EGHAVARTGGVRHRLRRRWARGLARRPHRGPGADGGRGRADFFRHAVDHLQPLHPARRTGSRHRAVGRPDRAGGPRPGLGRRLPEHFWWGSIFVAMAPVAAIGVLTGALFVPTSRDPATPPLDLGGLLLSTLTMGTLVFTIIEAPDRGWTAPATIGGFAVAA